MVDAKSKASLQSLCNFMQESAWNYVFPIHFSDLDMYQHVNNKMRNRSD